MPRPGRGRPYPRAGRGGDWSADPAWYAEAHRRIRDAAPGLLVSITSIRPADQPVAVVLDLLTTLASRSADLPDLSRSTSATSPPGSRNPARMVGRVARSISRTSTRRSPRLLARCRSLGIMPELGVMDLGFVSNAVALRDDGLLPARPWFLIELDSPAYGAGRQVAPSTAENYDLSRWSRPRAFPHGGMGGAREWDPGVRGAPPRARNGRPYPRRLRGCHHLPDGPIAPDNAAMVEWAVAAARSAGASPRRRRRHEPSLAFPACGQNDARGITKAGLLLRVARHMGGHRRGDDDGVRRLGEQMQATIAIEERERIALANLLARPRPCRPGIRRHHLS